MKRHDLLKATVGSVRLPGYQMFASAEMIVDHAKDRLAPILSDGSVRS